MGLRFGTETHYAIIDIDGGSQYRNQYDIERIRRIFSDSSIEVKVYRSSRYSGGIHIVLWFPRVVDSIGLGNFIEEHLVQKLGLVLGYGSLEVYPHQTTINKCVRLPFQNGFVELDESLKVKHRGYVASKSYDRLVKSIDSSGNMMNNTL